MDEALTRRARALHHPLAALETWRAQLTVVADAVTIADLQDALRARATMRCDLDAMKRSYVAGNADRMARHLNVAGASQLVGDRNAAWLPTLEGYLATDGAIAVGPTCSATPACRHCCGGALHRRAPAEVSDQPPGRLSSSRAPRTGPAA
jgi:hypothetical protein